YVKLYTYRSDEAPVPFTVSIKANNKVKEIYTEFENPKGFLGFLRNEKIHVHTFRIGP
ncbi:uncharacterized protein METZ01_LOCUS270224, partial [marine metagenome]